MTDNHDYNTPKEGATDWHVPLNENFEELDVDVEVRDVEANRSNYDPNAGAAFVETDTGIVYLGDGSSWVPALSVGRAERGQSNGVDGVNVVMGHPVNATTSGVVGATIGGGVDVPDEIVTVLAGSGVAVVERNPLLRAFARERTDLGSYVAARRERLSHPGRAPLVRRTDGRRDDRGRRSIGRERQLRERLGLRERPRRRVHS
jgi:hypothetical protein